MDESKGLLTKEHVAYPGDALAVDKDFIGFSLDGIHSDELNILRVSSGSRYDDTFLPTIQDKTVQVPGADGTYLFGSYFTQKQHTIKIAYDSMTESNFTKLKQILKKKTPIKLVYDESPYKAYWVKATQQPMLQYVCFDQDGKRVYKGEGTINLVSYEPYAHGTMKYYSGQDVPKWVIEYNFPITEPTLSLEIDHGSEAFAFDINNVGDDELDWSMSFPGNFLSAHNIEIYLNSQDKMVLQKKTGSLPKRLTIDTSLNLISGSDNIIYNRTKTSGTFFKIPMGQHKLYIKLVTPSGNAAPVEAGTVSIDYTYKFL